MAADPGAALTCLQDPIADAQQTCAQPEGGKAPAIDGAVSLTAFLIPPRLRTDSFGGAGSARTGVGAEAPDAIPSHRGTGSGLVQPAPTGGATFLVGSGNLRPPGTAPGTGHLEPCAGTRCASGDARRGATRWRPGDTPAPERRSEPDRSRGSKRLQPRPSLLQARPDPRCAAFEIGLPCPDASRRPDDRTATFKMRGEALETRRSSLSKCLYVVVGEVGAGVSRGQPLRRDPDRIRLAAHLHRLAPETAPDQVIAEDPERLGFVPEHLAGDVLLSADRHALTHSVHNVIGTPVHQPIAALRGGASRRKQRQKAVALPQLKPVRVVEAGRCSLGGLVILRLQDQWRSNAAARIQGVRAVGDLSRLKGGPSGNPMVIRHAGIPLACPPPAIAEPSCPCPWQPASRR